MVSRNRRPKRAAEDFAKTSLFNGDEQATKKRRFDSRNPSTLATEALEEDAILDLDEIGKPGLQRKRNAVELDGYDSDSSIENFEARAKAKVSAANRDGMSKQKDVNDMFADLDESFKDGDEDEELVKENKKSRKEVRFMDEDEIEGQVSSSKAGGHVSADFSLDPRSAKRDTDVESSSESGNEEERDMVVDVDDELGAGAKKKHAPKLDAFNMRNEVEEGKFDESGNFVRNATDPHAMHDSWLEGSSKSDMKKAREAHEKREQARRQRDIEDDALSTGEILGRLITQLEDGETGLEALARLESTKKPQRKAQRQRNKRKNDMDLAMDNDEEGADTEEAKRKETILELTAAADMLLTRGQTEIYEAEKAALIRQYRRETGQDWLSRDRGDVRSSRDARQWNYRWADARDGGEIHGPYDMETMQAWNEAGYFGEGVEFRQAAEGAAWTRMTDFMHV